MREWNPRRKPHSQNETNRRKIQRRAKEEADERHKRAQAKIDPKYEMKYPILEEYFENRQRNDAEIIKEISKRVHNCPWCEKFKENNYMICIHCGRGLT